MTSHPFEPNPKSIGGMVCAVCGKMRTHIMHSGQGVADPIEVDEPAPEPPQAIVGGEMPEWGPIYPTTPEDPRLPNDYLLIESYPGFTEVRFHIPNGDRMAVLNACSEFLKLVAPAAENES